MKRFKFGHACGAQWKEATDCCIHQLGQLNGENLGFLYTTDMMASELIDIVDYLKKYTSIKHWIGSVGIGVCGDVQEYFNVPAIALMVGEFPEHAFQVFHSAGKDMSILSTLPRQWGEDKQPLFGIVHGTPHNEHIATHVYQLSEYLGDGFLVGGLTSSRTEFLQVADEVIVQDELSGVIFSNNVEVITRLTQGCAIIGENHEVTQCKNNMITCLDNRPALEVLAEEVGEYSAHNLPFIYDTIFAALPIIGSDRGDYFVRNIMNIDIENGAIMIGDYVEKGRNLRFARRDAETAHHDMLSMLSTIKTSLNGKKLCGALYHSCIGRGENLFGRNSLEARTIHAILGDCPIIGFFGQGEISHQHLYGYTGVLSVFVA